MTEDFESNPVGTAAKLKELEAEIKELNRICTMRGERMQVMYEYMIRDPEQVWLLYVRADNWFDADGIPQENSDG